MNHFEHCSVPLCQNMASVWKGIESEHGKVYLCDQHTAELQRMYIGRLLGDSPEKLDAFLANMVR